MIFELSKDGTEITRWERRRMSIKLRAKPKEVEAIEWIKNEPHIREFVKNDNLLRFPSEGRLEVWNEEEKCWINVPLRHYIIRGVKGELYPCSPEVLQRTYEIIE